MIRARQEGRTESAIIAEMGASHQKDFADFGIRFDHYGSTDSPSNRALTHEFWAALRGAGTVVEKDVEQLYDPKAGSFLADRFVKGTCPVCKTPEQYGDSCEKCGSTYSPQELIDPVSTLSGARPELRSARHWFVRLEPYRGFLKEWTAAGTVHPSISRWLATTFLKEELRDWDVSRPAPYFGFEIPDAPGNYFYVWVDAPLGYIASTQDWCAKSGGDWTTWWRDPATEIHHFIGKDIVYFHTLFWPVMLKAAGYPLPRQVHIHGFLTVNNAKMSKRSGTFVRARTYLEHLDPAWLRYYYATKLTEAADDIDLNLAEFADKINADLVGKVVNLASRTARFVPRLADAYPDDGGLFAAGAAAGAAIAAAYDVGDFSQAMRVVMGLADRANEYVERAAPWALKKDPARAAELVTAVTVALNLFRQLAVYLAPVLPRLAEQAGELLGAPITAWSAAAAPVTGNALQPFSRLMDRVDPKKIEDMINASRFEAEANQTAVPALSVGGAAAGGAPNERPSGAAPLAATSKASGGASNSAARAVAVSAPAAGGGPVELEPLAPLVPFADFAKLDLRVGLVLAAEDVPKAKKIVKLTLGLGALGTRTVFAGIRTAYTPEQLIGRLIVFVANLEPRTMSFGVSEGMAIAAGPGGQDIHVLSPDSGAQPGQRVH
jgi:methionyl-tRNA synthetase